MASGAFSDQYDVMQHFMKVHGKLKGSISADFVLFEPTEQEIKFIVEQMKLAQHLKDYIKHPETAQKVYDMLTQEIQTTVILRRNTNKNPLLNAVLNRTKELEEQETINIKDVLTEGEEKK